MAGFSAKWVYEYLKKQAESGIENHALLIMQGNDIVFEEYNYPYSADMPHTLFSVTKSIASTAAGFAVSEGLLSLDTRIDEIFEGYEKCKGSGWENLTLRSVLTMNSNKKFTFLQDMTADYNTIFMEADFRKKGGFLYSNNDAHIVAAAVQKLSGQSLTEYLTPRLFEPLGIEVPFWETNEAGECIGGTGCYLKARDLAKICRCYADGGKYNGKQVIPEFWCREATKIQHQFKENEGYGYLFWIKNGIFSMTGMFGQLVSYIPQYDTVLVSLNSCIAEGMNSSLAESVLMKAFAEESTAEDEKILENYLKSRRLKIPSCEKLPPVHEGKEYYITAVSDAIAKVLFPQSVIPRTLTCSFAKRPKSNPDKVSFSLKDNALNISWLEEEDKVTISCGLDGEPRMSECVIKGYPYKIWAYCYAEGDKFKLVVKPLNTLATHYIDLEFVSDGVKMSFKSNPCFTEFILKSAMEPEFFNKHRLVRTVTQGVVKLVVDTTARPVKFRLKK
ncbi:MAG: serine hydrolase [Clostridia bacterium]|nr:serine hydrolase [Clostridia bacterium]